MSEIIVSEFAKFVSHQLGSAVNNELKLALGVKKELKRMKSNMSSIQACLEEAEKQQSTSKHVKNWLEKLQDVMYDIEDLLDDVATEVKIQDMNKGMWRKQVRKFFSRTNSLVLRMQWAHRIQNLRTTLDLINKDKNRFSLNTSNAKGSMIKEPADSSETCSKVNKLEILGRDEDTETIVNFILSRGDCKSLSVLPIVGFGGVGKSTLAKLIYSDHRIDESFDRKLWVYVSEKFNVKNILTQILSMLTGEARPDINVKKFTLEELMMRINEKLKHTKYLLILDDLWNDNSSEWRRLKDLLDVGVKGSMVVVTTRDSKVASMVSDDQPHRLTELSNETCLLIFKQLAFKDGEKIEPTLWKLAENIVEKSKGLPLLVTTLGNLLRGETDEREWHRVIRKLEQGHADILSILKLSYDQLPSYLKLCFRICSIWGKGGEIKPLFHLSPFLMALGFLPYDDIQGDSLEYLGSKCINDLLSKSLLQKEKDTIHGMFGNISMHDFLYDLAKLMAGDELQIINSSTKEIPDKVRYIRLDEDDLSREKGLEKLLKKAKKARLLLINTSGHCISKALMESIMSNLKCLRVLHLKYCQFEELPRTIGYMKHLRYLSLVGNIEIQQLPDSICNLVNLQTLLIGGCRNLQKLPASIGRLQNLRCLSITIPQECLPAGIGLIETLRTLFLYECPRLAFLPIGTKALENLESLWITGCKELDLAHGSWSHEGCLNSLRFLAIHCLPKFTRLPICEKGASFTSLQTLAVMHCEGLIELTGWIEYLTSLKTLIIGSCSNLVGLPRSFYLLDRLERLIIYGCPMLSERCAPGSGKDWHLLSRIPRIEIDGERINLE